MRARLLLLPLFLLLGSVAASNWIAASSTLPPHERQLATSGLTENSAWNPVTRRIQGLEMALVPAGCFIMGTTDAQMQEALEACDAYYGAFGCQQDFTNEQPAHEVCISEPYWIDVTPVSNFQYLRVTKSRWPSPYTDLRLPLQAIPWREAAAYCRMRGSRLPTEAEWEYAARGPDSLVYPYGDSYDIQRTTLRKVSPAQSGQIPRGASWVGALDMSGGMAEWVSDWYGPYPQARRVDPQGPPAGSSRILRGGDWFAHASYSVRTSFREPTDPEFATSKNGFRCARDF